MKKFNYKNIYSLLVSSILRYWYYYLGASVCLVLTQYIQSEIPFLAKDVVEYLEGNLKSLDIKIFFLYAIGIIIFRTFSRFLFFYPARLIQYDMRLDLIEKVQNSFPGRLANYSKGQYYQLLVSDLDEIRAFLGFAALQVLNIIIALAILLPKLYLFNSSLLKALLPMIVAMFVFSIVVNKNKKNYNLSQKLGGEIQQLIIESFIGKKTIKNYHNEKIFINNFRSKSAEELDNFWNASKRISFVMPLFQLGVGISFLWGASIIYNQQIGISALVLFSGFIFLFLEPISFLSWITVVFMRAIVSWKRLSEFSSELNTETFLEQKLNSLNENLQIKDEMIDLTILFWDNLANLKIDKSKIVFIGNTGVGKSYLLEQLAFLLNKTFKVSYCAQEPYLFDDSLFNNIVLGQYSTLNQEEMKTLRKKTLTLINIFELENLAEGESILDLQVGEHGKHLSGGQAKRVALIRTILMDCEYIIWDDPFSSVDIIQERIIWDELNALGYFENKTLIYSTHRLTTLNQAEKIYFADKEINQVEHLEIQNKKIKEFFEQQMV